MARSQCRDNADIDADHDPFRWQDSVSLAQDRHCDCTLRYFVHGQMNLNIRNDDMNHMINSCFDMFYLPFSVGDVLFTLSP